MKRLLHIIDIFLEWLKYRLWTRHSLRIKIVLLLTTALTIFGGFAAGISYKVFVDTSIAQHKEIATGVAKLAAGVIEPDKVRDFLSRGETAPDYLKTKMKLSNIRNNAVDIKYLYVYKILPDGCHVVFDLDTDDVPGAAPGMVIPFDNAFKEYIPTLLSGGNIEPIISNETYGWLLTAYVPVYDDEDNCQCYAAADISMDWIRQKAYSYLIKLCIIFLAVWFLLLVPVITISNSNIIIPINRMAKATNRFAFNSSESIDKSLEWIHRLNIRTGDEIENLYRAFTKMAEDSVNYINDIRKKSETISTIHNALIFSLADMVEKRDKNTGEHIRKTAEYARIIMESLRRRGDYKEELTDSFIENVVTSAPLHDIGKINVPDGILNKPGKLDDEEFVIMKSHTSAGGNIISQIIEKIPDSEYLIESRNLAAYHHEKWNGAGYPCGLKGEEIPLSSRIMAVADVFDALVSNRSYKKGFSYDKAFMIINEGSGNHFDPTVVAAFFDAKEEVLSVAEKFRIMEEQKDPGKDNAWQCKNT